MKTFNAKAESLYFTDNGRVLCGNHLGMTAKATGRDISGQEIMECPNDVLREYPEITCETCRVRHSH